MKLVPRMFFGMAFFGGSSLARKASSGGGLVVLRALFISLLMGPILITAVTAFLTDRVTPEEAWAVPVGVALSGLSILSPALVARRELDASDEAAFAAWYRTNFFLAFALCQAPFLIAFVLTFLVDALLPILLALPGLIVGMFVLGPTKRNLEKLQGRVARQGSVVDVVAALDQGAPSS